MKFLTYILLYPLYLLYLGIMFIRNMLFDFELFPSIKLDCAVISIGNLSFGGTGKTPFTLALAEELKSKYSVAILSRGYKRGSRGTLLVTDGKKNPTDWKACGDEPFLMSQKLTDVPIVVDEDRYRGGQYLVDNFNPEIILLDDGFQHRKLQREVDIVLFDASRQSRLNFWREPLSSAKRASVFVLTKSDDAAVLANWKICLSKFDKPIVAVKTRVDDKLIGLNDNKLNIEQLNGKSVVTFSGIANPESFNDTIIQLGCNVVQTISFKDHHHYTANDLEEILKQYNDLKPEYILTTEKDIIKLPQSDLPIYALSIRMDLSKELVDNILKLAPFLA